MERGEQHVLRGRVAQNNLRGLDQIRGREVRPLPQRLLISVIDKGRAAAGGIRAVDVAPAITDQITLRQLDPVRGSGAEEQAGLWLPAIARLAEFTSRMETNLDAIERGQRRAQLRMHGFDGGTALRSAPHIGLVCDDNQEKACILQDRAGLLHTIVKRKLVYALRRIRVSLPQDGPV